MTFIIATIIAVNYNEALRFCENVTLIATITPLAFTGRAIDLIARRNTLTRYQIIKSRANNGRWINRLYYSHFRKWQRGLNSRACTEALSRR